MNDLTDIDKFNYLRSLLERTAHEAIAICPQLITRRLSIFCKSDSIISNYFKIHGDPVEH